MPSKKSSSPMPSAQPSQPPNEKAAPLEPNLGRDFDDPVNEASDESFPASDPPAWTETTATKDGN